MSVNIDPKVMERLAKLKRMVERGAAEGASEEQKLATEREAQQFAALLSRLLMEHDLQMTDIEWEEKDQTIEEHYVEFDDKEMKRPRRVPWMEALAFTLAPAFNCKVLVRPGKNVPLVVGRKNDALLFDYMFVTLTRAADNFSTREAKTYRRKMKRTCSICKHGLSWHELRNAVPGAGPLILDDPKAPWDCAGHLFENSLLEAHGFRRSWLNAFIKRLKERLDEERARVHDEAAAGGQALVRVDNALAKVQEHIENNMKTSKVGGLSHTWHGNKAGDRAGRDMADRMNLRADPMGGGKTPSQLN